MPLSFWLLFRGELRFSPEKERNSIYCPALQEGQYLKNAANQEREAHRFSEF